MKKLLLNLLCLLAVGFASHAAEQTITIVPSDCGSGSVYTSGSFTKDNIEFSVVNIYPNTGQIKVNATSSNNGFTLSNTSELPGAIRTIKLYTDQNDNSNYVGTMYLNTGSSKITAAPSESGDKGITAANESGSGYVTTFSATSTTDTFFKIGLTVKGKGTVRMTKIEIIYEDGGETPSPEAKMEWSKNEFSVVQGQEESANFPTLTYTGEGAVTYSSSNEDVAAIIDNSYPDGLIIGDPGTTTITATDGTLSASYILTVTAQSTPQPIS